MGGVVDRKARVAVVGDSRRRTSSVNAHAAGSGEGEAARDPASAEHEFSVNHARQDRGARDFRAIGHHVDSVFAVAFRQRRGEHRGAGYRTTSSTNPATERTERRNERDPVPVRSRTLRLERRNPGFFGGLSFRFGALP